MGDTEGSHSLSIVEESDLLELLALMRAYCDFYEVKPSDHSLLELSRALIEDPEREGIQLIARDGDGRAVGFATVFWTWATTRGARIAIMHDLFVDPAARGSGLADRLIEACGELCTERGVASLQWETALDNLRAQAVYDRVGGVREQWLSYHLDFEGS
jgi:GNAT superfamily N-acetyltransferase